LISNCFLTPQSSHGRDAHATILTGELPEEDLKAGDVGSVVECHVAPGMEDGYSVEFFDMTGQTVAVVTVPASLLRSPTPADRPAVRAMSAEA
jgi:Domain of unknown function (DUF4926)